MAVLKKMSLTSWIFIGFVVGIIVGLIVGPPIAVIRPLGDLLLRLLMFIVAPIIFFTLAVGIAGITGAKFGRMFGTAMGLFIATTALAIIIALLVAVPIGLSMPLPAEIKEITVTPPPPIGRVFLEIVPTSVVDGFARNAWLQIIFSAMVIGIATGFVGATAKPLRDVLEAGMHVMLRVVQWVFYYAPIGVFALIAWTVGTIGPRVLIPYAGLVVIVYGVCIIHAALSYSLLLRFVPKLNPLKFFGRVKEAPFFAFATCSSAATLPVTLRVLRDNVKMSETTRGFVAPLGATLNMDGTAIYQAVSAVFLANSFGVPITFEVLGLILVTAVIGSIGTAGVPGAGLIMLGVVLGTIGVPAGAGMALILGIDRILDMPRTAINVTGDLVVAALVGHIEGEKVAPELYVRA